MQNKLQKTAYELKKLNKLESLKAASATSTSVKPFSNGFTLVEVMIAMAIFTILVTVGIGSVLGSMSQHKLSQNTRSVMDSLNYVMEDMARNIRLGSNIHCYTSSETVPLVLTADPIDPNNCDPAEETHTIIFNDLRGDQLKYTITPGVGSMPNKILKQQVTDAEPQNITPPEVVIDYTRSGFMVRGACPSAGTVCADNGQPTVVIRLAGKVIYQDTETRFSIGTTVTPRALDN